MSNTSAVIQLLRSQQHTFLHPTDDLNTSLLSLGKQYLDPLASSVSEAQLARQKEHRNNRKRKLHSIEDNPESYLRIQQVYTEGFGVEQIWQQAKRVLDAANYEVQRRLPLSQAGALGGDELGSAKKRRTAPVEDEDVEEVELSEPEDDSLGEEGVDWEFDGVDDDDDAELGENVGEDDSSISDADLPHGKDDVKKREQKPAKDKHGLNDEFFSIDDFNKNTEFLEGVDLRGADDGAASDEEDVDWDADPLAEGAQVGLGKPKRQTSSSEPVDSVASENEDGPTFGDADLDAPDSNEEDEDENTHMDNNTMSGLSNTNDIMYNDFFAPPGGSKLRKKTLKGQGRREPSRNFIPSKNRKAGKGAFKTKHAFTSKARTVPGSSKAKFRAPSKARPGK